MNAGNGEWGRKMHFDLLDAVDFAVTKGIALRDQVAIMGASYGGYAALVGVTFTPDIFACAVDMVGPSNLLTLLDTMPPYWKGFRKDMIRMLGADKDSEDGEWRRRRRLLIVDARARIFVLQASRRSKVARRFSLRIA